MTDGDTCTHGAPLPATGPHTGCPDCLHDKPIVVGGWLVFNDDQDIVWLPLHLITVIRTADIALDVAVVPAGHPGLELPHDETGTWYRLHATDPHRVARNIAGGRHR